MVNPIRSSRKQFMVGNGISGPKNRYINKIKIFVENSINSFLSKFSNYLNFLLFNYCNRPIAYWYRFGNLA